MGWEVGDLQVGGKGRSWRGWEEMRRWAGEDSDREVGGDEVVRLQALSLV